MKMNYTEGLTYIKQRINEILEKRSSIIIAIDGMAASGKTTLAKVLKKQYKVEVIHMDDFFLQDHQKTDNRLNEVDGYIDYERFEVEVILPLKNNSAFSYQAYNCQTKKMSDKFVNKDCEIYIIEGVYALRESFNDIYDLKILMLIDEEIQFSRITKRNQSKLVERFKQEWIPRENKYIKYFELEKSADIVIVDNRK